MSVYTLAIGSSLSSVLGSLITGSLVAAALCVELKRCDYMHVSRRYDREEVYDGLPLASAWWTV